ncbi:MAG: hypothetical protein LBE56_12800 [Tannerella sp.]|nr:hypothetical protein [Tannerella sp.]
MEIVNGVSQEGMDYKTVKFNHSSVQEALKQYVVNDTSNPFFMVEKGKKVNAKDKLKELYRINNKDVKPTDDETILIKDALKHLTPADISLQTYNTIAGKPVIEITTAVGTFYRKAPNEIQNALTFFTEVNKQINALRKGKKKMQVVTYKDGEGNT